MNPLSSLQTLFSHKNTSSIIALVSYLSINCIFIFKYVPRAGLNPWIISAFYIAIIFAVGIGYKQLVKHLPNTTIRKLTWIGTILMILFMLFLLIKIDPYSVNVDRWSAIHNFLVYLFDGKYPYMAQTHLGGYGSPFPVWQMVHIPFYLSGDVGYALIFFLLLTLYTSDRFFKKSSITLFIMLSLALSPAYWWEVSVRSDFFDNTLFCLCMIMMLDKKKINLNNHGLLIAIMAGLLLSTRIIVILPFVVLYAKEYFNLPLFKKIYLPTIGLLAFMSTFIILYFWSANDLLYFKYNPFILQSRQSNFVIMSGILLFAIFLSFQNKKANQIYLYSAVVYFIMVVSSYLWRGWLNGFEFQFFNSYYDVSYLSIILPWLITGYAFSLKKVS